MLRRDVEYVLTWNAADHAWTATPIRRERHRIVPLETDVGQVGVPRLMVAWQDDA
ncbi:hypothetical protein [Haloactinopolyspora sp.]|uniref:hypothetical protein n=1 Tax=Haloactinopolyspora sp. TaxID=1966353 RepID=UPI002610E856|nr:hypothetical protein [Haloactinopolyspora sp.]